MTTIAADPTSSRRPHRHHRRAAHLGVGDDPPPAHPHDRAGRRACRQTARRWVSSRPAFLLPVRVLGKLFRRLFLTRLMALHEAGRLGFYGSTRAHLADRRAFLRHLAPVRKKRWVVYAKPPFAGPETVLAYLSRYTHRVAISNSRLLRFDETGVTFRYKDYRRAGADRQQVDDRLPPTSSSVASCSTSCRRGFTASATMACSPAPPARPVSTTSASCSGWRHPPPPMR